MAVEPIHSIKMGVVSIDKVNRTNRHKRMETKVVVVVVVDDNVISDLITNVIVIVDGSD